MPSLLSRFKRSPSTSSSKSEDQPSEPAAPPHSTFSIHRDSTQINKNTPQRSADSISISSTSSSPDSVQGRFVEVFGDGQTKAKDITTTKNRPAPLAVPASNTLVQGNVVGTPKFTISGEGSSPRSLTTDSPISRGSPVPPLPRGLGLGLDSSNSSRRVRIYSQNLFLNSYIHSLACLVKI
jgi:hypothetical protein